MSEATVVGGALVPGMPHLLAASPAPSWKRLAEAVLEVGSRLRAANPDAVLLLSTQWFTVLGHQVQLDPNPRGQRTDENWYAYDFGHLDYDLRTDTALAEAWAAEIDTVGMQARRTHYEHFPIDTGTVVASRLLDPDRTLPMAQVSCNLYADADALFRVGAAGVAAARRLGRRIAVVGVSGLSSGLTPRWISPKEDEISDPAHEQWNSRLLGLLAAGDLAAALDLREAYSRAAAADSQLRVLPWLVGAEGAVGPGEVLASGPIWGTGAAVVHWPA
ncbi:2-amino-5-chlorophenol 1,6-dioxygenase subunit alpha [Pseudonocardia asaccharolytica]|uniref:Extradiol ring-cleavage dioxygenase class III enzyme subunit B domain-containing protein n=1 Tax=Pseudonocardia asaccharolytica DSM 44247 = NBRC 16224 TaxID=1123024 RepID=A0A511CXK3_9PSEU|nr:2-amino-5-chlorophenol 1,6-dioxygenase subunit alpha [Pseudonocardia asaccharolytica]GEL17207.1 hypothetical protein PA7_10440 [Pseudonocardia asaccharolytica DSM 44247 = NBRC 16224]